MKLYLCGLTSAGNEQNLRGLIEPILEYFNGLIWTFHNPIKTGTISGHEPEKEIDAGYTFLEQNKKEGKIITTDWCDRFHFSMNHFLWQGPMKEGDVFIVLDTLERITPVFCKDILPQLIKQMDDNNVQVVQNFGKGMIYRYNELLEFHGSPHTFPINITGQIMNMELEEKYFLNVRAEQRDKFHFINHYLKYYLYPAGSNHLLLGLEKNGDPKELYPKLELQRLKFRKYLTEHGIELKYQAFIDYLLEHKSKNEQLPDEMKEFINGELILNNVYTYYVLGDRNIIDDHDFSKIKKI